VNSLAILKQYNAQDTSIHFVNFSPAANPAILLNHFLLRVVNHMFNPFQPGLLNGQGAAASAGNTAYISIGQ